jgi:hypothetical protein
MLGGGSEIVPNFNRTVHSYAGAYRKPLNRGHFRRGSGLAMLVQSLKTFSACAHELS